MASDLFRQTLEEMVDRRHPLVILSRRIPWKTLEDKVSPLLVPERRSASAVELEDLFGASVQLGQKESFPHSMVASTVLMKDSSRKSFDLITIIQ
jgi:hypothetical protein